MQWNTPQWMLPPLCFTVGMLLSSFPLFPPNITTVFMTRHFRFSFTIPQYMFEKLKSASSSSKTMSHHFLFLFRLMPFSFSEWLLSSCWCRTHLGVGNNTSQGLLFLFRNWFQQFSPKHLHVWDTEPVSFQKNMIAGNSYAVYTSKKLFEQNKLAV